ncbi:MAG: NAD(P)/FAD-dependent oxidoreductase [Steroidobacteraceae bacterium]
MEATVDNVVVGAGVVGLAVARTLALRGEETVLLEAAAAVGTGISARNSEVLHAGLYYAPGSLKARLCVRGRELLDAYCGARGIDHRLCGKLVVARTAAQCEELERLAANGLRNGVADLQMLAAAEARALEPRLRCEAVLHSPSTGIIDSHALMQALLADFERAGGLLALRARVAGGECQPGGFTLQVGGVGASAGAGEDAQALRTRRLVNAAGLGAQDLARSLRGVPAGSVPPAYYAKGHYFTLRGRSPFTRLVYPVPEPGGLGIHLTLDLAGRARFGPDVRWVDAPSYDVEPALATAFASAVRGYWPDIAADALEPAYAGVRPKLVPAGAPAADFLIQGPERHGVAGLVNLFGIESPGLTASLAIAEYVAAVL